MKIVFTGGGTGGHFYPIIAIAEQLHKEADKQKIEERNFYFLSNSPYDSEALFENGIEFRKISAGKLRTYFSIQNFFDLFKTALGVFQSIFTLWSIYPDVIFSKGGYPAFPVVFAARLLRIPVVMHDSDTIPGRVSRFTGSFARRIALGYPEAAAYFSEEKVAWTGIPVRENLWHKEKEGSHEYLNLEQGVPTLLILGGSSGAQQINEVILSSVKELLPTMQIIHQVGSKNEEEYTNISDITLENSAYKSRYHVVGFLNELAFKMAAGVTDLVVSRAGATSIANISLFELPCILIPITNSNGDHQRKNAYHYARIGAAHVIEELNLSNTLLVHAIKEILSDEKIQNEMKESAQGFARRDAGIVIAQELMTIAHEHSN
ncbi:MAG: UDP-N-acetylglucosamine--N-acetylmuramyl-(pentapeptide) pyrophosphoryl-undecaprenol N-acetylglucosamine transferase [Flavobacteriaceae bacterium]|jgi:UDP-N-acetylglucosamine--N-acetylmuramyl-(pentapeptide) pyrophosphoryl-undecaprenol N-acetylglucosamine transferase